ncbi:MAG: helicase [Rhodobiaceae bacterium]|nr:helicase [Rhodobiaceae bacterium]
MKTAQENLVAVLGPTNTGKTHLAIERMLAHDSGMIGLPLRLLAREVYGKIVQRIGAEAVALITGEEKIKPAGARYFVCTVEAMPRDVEVSCLAIDEVQLAADLDRGHVFTDRILGRRGSKETLLLGASTIRPLIETLLPGANILSRPRLSQLTYAGQTKITRLPRRAAIVAFSADEVYAIAELVRRQRGGTAVVLGALSPRTRNAQVALYENGDVDYLVATDAIGMGLNLDINHVAFAADRKFDGHQYRVLNPAELGQIAGRAGRHMRDGSFGVTGQLAPFDTELAERLETHRFDPLQLLQWRNPNLDFTSIAALKNALALPPPRAGLVRALTADDERALDLVCRDQGLVDMASSRAGVERLWDVCQIPDYRKIAPASHAELVATIFRFLQRDGRISDDWFAGQLAFADRMDGDIDTLSNRITHVRTWTFVANRPDWLADPEHWQQSARDIEDRLSDALHERLAQRFVDRRTSVLMRRLRDNDDLELEVNAGDVKVEGQHVGHLHGFCFSPDPAADGTHGKALRAAAIRGLAAEYGRRSQQLGAAADGEFALGDSGALTWRGEPVATLRGADNPVEPAIVLIADEQLQGADRAAVQERLERWLGATLRAALAPLMALREIETQSANVRGIAFRLIEGFGMLERREVTEQVRALDPDERRVLRQAGVRFGAHAIFVPALLKPGAARLTRLLWALGNGGLEQERLAHLPQLSAQGLMSVPVDAEVPAGYYAAIGYQICGRRAVRVDMLERLADLIRPLVAWKPAEGAETPPEGALGQGRFAITPAMMSLLGCSGEDFAAVLRAMGFRRQPPQPQPPAAAAVDADSQSETAAGPAGEMGTGAAPAVTATVTVAEDGQEATLDLAENPVSPVSPSSAPPSSGERAPSASETLGVWRPHRPAPHRRPARGAHKDRAGVSAEAPARHSDAGDPASRRGHRPASAAAGKGGKPRRGKFAQHGPREEHADRAGHGAAGRGGGNRQRAKEPHRPPRKEFKVDPLSPFAALQDLKRQLENGKSGSAARSGKADLGGDG